MLLRQALSVAVLNPLVGMLGYIGLWFASFLFSGFFLPENDVPWPLKVGGADSLRNRGRWWGCSGEETLRMLHCAVSAAGCATESRRTRTCYLSAFKLVVGCGRG